MTTTTTITIIIIIIIIIIIGRNSCLFVGLPKLLSVLGVSLSLLLLPHSLSASAAPTQRLGRHCPNFVDRMHWFLPPVAFEYSRVS